jgi:Sigma-70, region 4
MTATAVELPERSPAPRRLRVLPAEPPRTRADCLDGPRPCPWACRHNLRALKGWRPGRPSCSLDAADEGGMTLGEIGTLFGISRERARQVQVLAIEHLAEGLRLAGVLTSLEARRVPADVREAISR